MSDDLFYSRLKRARDVFDFKVEDRTPVLNCCSGWAFYDTNVNAWQAYHDYKLLEKTVVEFYSAYDFDCATNSFTNYAFPVLEELGNTNYELDKETGVLSVKDHSFIFPEDYIEASKDVVKFNKVAFQRKFPNTTTKKFAKAVSKFLEFGQFSGNGASMWKDKIHVPLMYNNAKMVMPSLEILNASTRGIKDLSLDLRRHKEELKTYLNGYWEQSALPTLKADCNQGPHNDVSDISTSMLAHSILNLKQFDEVYWPQQKQIVDAAIEHKLKYYVFCEAQFTRLADHFKDMPRGTFLVYVEQDDLRELRKVLPNAAVAGGIPTAILGYKSPEEVYEYTKALICDMGPGYFVGPDKVLAYKNDATRENLRAMIKASVENK